MDGGTITGPVKNGHISGIKANNVQFTGGVIENFEAAILYMDWKQIEGIKIGGNATFKNNYSDIHLLEDQVFTIQGDLREMQVCIVRILILHFPVELRLLGYQNLCLAG